MFYIKPNGKKPLTIFVKLSMLGVWQDSEYVSWPTPSPLNQLTGFYMMATLAFNEFKLLTKFPLFLICLIK